MEIPYEVVAAKELMQIPLLTTPGVVGVGLGMREEDGEFYDELAVRIFVEDASAPPPGLPVQIAGVPVCIVERRFVLCSGPDTARYTDLRGGVRIENPVRGFGTLGAVVRDNDTGMLAGLTCQHVVGDPGQVFPDTVWQPNIPQYLPGVSPFDNLGPVQRSDFPNTTLVPTIIKVGATDSAVFSLDAARQAGRTFSRAIADKGLGLPDLVGAVTATADPTPGQQVRVRGHATGEPRQGVVLTQYLDMQWNRSDPYSFLFGQWEVVGSSGGLFCRPGDSGSLVLDAYTPTAVGLLHGTNEGASAGRFGYMSGINVVQAMLRVSVVW